MLFNSPEFLFFFVPIVIIGFYLLRKFLLFKSSIFWLFVASLFFYAWWNPIYLGLILSSIIINFKIGSLLQGKTSNNFILWLGIVFNIGLLAFFKYSMFVVNNINVLFNTGFDIGIIILPLAISFFTFQQIAYLIDSKKGKVTHNNDFLSYCLFVTFFPQLIAGPIVHHREMMPQFSAKRTQKFEWKNISIGLTIIAIGLFKKVIIADQLELYATPIFNAANNGETIDVIEAWVGAMAYTFQIYFDFSGYSDMAIGLSRLFGIRLPLNFFSPYKAVNIIDFWRRWHMTLSRFLRDYLYIPLGGNRKGPARRHMNLIITMLLGGLWHGAAWTFVIWGGLHGIYLIINHIWQRTSSKYENIITLPSFIAKTLTFLAIMLAWVFFRSESVESAMHIISAMTDFNDPSLRNLYHELWGHSGLMRLRYGVQMGNMAAPLLIICLLICWYLPNTSELMRYYRPFIGNLGRMKVVRKPVLIVWHPNIIWGILIGILMMIGILKAIYEPSQVFLYFQF